MNKPEPEQDKTKPGSSLAGSVEEFLPGQILDGRYEVISLLGKGGMGMVYRVRQTILKKEFALKTLNKHLMSPKAVLRFQKEARTQFAVDHPSIVQVHDSGVFEDQTPFIVMELVVGQTLGDYIKDNGRMTVAKAIETFVPICFGLAYAHEKGIVHRDIKPSNIIILDKGSKSAGENGGIKILDFGIAKYTLHEEGEVQALTRTGEVFGSPLYMSPEQCGGLQVDNRSDIYSLGCCLFEALTGLPPFIGESALATMLKHQTTEAPTLKEATLGEKFPEGLEQIVFNMLRKTPSDRYSNLGIVARHLGGLKRGEKLSTVGFMKSRVRDDSAAVGASNGQGRLIGLLALTSIASFCAGGALVHQVDVMQPKPNAVSENSQRQSKKDEEMPHKQLQQPGSKQQPAMVSQSSGTGEPSNIPQSSADVESLIRDSTFRMAPAAILNLVQHPTTNRRLDLPLIELSDSDFKTIGQATWVAELFLIRGQFDNNGFKWLVNMPLWTINVSSSNFDDTGAAFLSHIKTLHGIVANETSLTSSGIKSLATLPHLELLSLSHCRLGDDSLEAISHCKTIENLDIRKSKVTGQGLKYLVRSPLHTLNIEATATDDQGIKYLMQMPKLQVIVLSETAVTTEGVRQLADKPQLQEVNVQRCKYVNGPELAPIFKKKNILLSFEDDKKNAAH